MIAGNRSAAVPTSDGNAIHRQPRAPRHQAHPAARAHGKFIVGGGSEPVIAIGQTVTPNECTHIGCLRKRAGGKVKSPLGIIIVAAGNGGVVGIVVPITHRIKVASANYRRTGQVNEIGRTPGNYVPAGGAIDAVLAAAPQHGVITIGQDVRPAPPILL